MTWTPDPALEQHFSRIITRAFDEMRTHEEREGKIADNQAAARGTFLSGNTLHGRKERAVEGFRSAGRRSIDETIEALRSVFGSIPPEAVAWLRSHLSHRFDSYADARANSLADDRIRRQMNVPRGDVDRAMTQVASGLKRDLEIALVPIELRARLGSIARGDLPSKAMGSRGIDAFISHAGEDKPDVARPLANELMRRGFKVWLDQYELNVGMSVYAAIDDGLRRSRFGVVILSPNFFAKNWPQNELHALAALGAAEGRNKILPVWHNLDHDGVAAFSPLLADVYAAKTADGIEKVANDIAAALGAS